MAGFVAQADEELASVDVGLGREVANLALEDFERRVDGLLNLAVSFVADGAVRGGSMGELGLERVAELGILGTGERGRPVDLAGHGIELSSVQARRLDVMGSTDPAFRLRRARL